LSLSKDVAGETHDYHTDLAAWAKEEANAGDDDMVNPGATDFDAYAEWMQYVENAFIEQST